MLKIKVNLDKKSLTSIINDMQAFKVLKKDGSINKNKFLNLLFENYYQDYQNITNKAIEKANLIMQKYNINNPNLSHDLANGLYEAEFMSSEDYFDKSLTFYLDNHNEFIFNSINSGIYYQSASSYFRNLINHYLLLPEYKRECVIYRKNVDIINEAIKNNTRLTIELEKRVFEFAPYKITSTKEELYSYLIGYDKDKIEAIHIYKIINVMAINKPTDFTKEQIEILDLNIEKGAQFAENNLCEATIELTKRGIKLFNQRYLHRPTPTKIDGYRYTFYCSFTQLFFYFIAFCGEIKVITPKYLGKKIYKAYYNYIQKFENDERRKK